MDRTVVLGWEIKSINSAPVCTCVLLHICVQRSQGEEFIIRDILELPSGQASCFAVLQWKDVIIRAPLPLTVPQAPGLCPQFLPSKALMSPWATIFPFWTPSDFSSSVCQICDCGAKTLEAWRWFSFQKTSCNEFKTRKRNLHVKR